MLVIVLAIAGLVTLRSNVAKIWRENYEAETEKNRILTLQLEEARDLKHEALSEATTAKNLLLLEQSKTDLTPLKEKMDEQLELLRKIYDVLLSNGEAITVPSK